MLSRWQGWLAAAVVAVVASVLVILDLTDTGLRRWWGDNRRRCHGEVSAASAQSKAGPGVRPGARPGLRLT